MGRIDSQRLRQPRPSKLRTGLDYDWIVPDRVAQGAFPDPPTAAFADGFDIVVFCAQELQPRHIRKPSGAVAIYVPLDDDPYRPVDLPSARLVNDVARDIAQRVASGSRALITCAMGANRSGLVTGLVLMHLYRCSGREAVRRIKQHRRVKGGAPLMNPMFAGFLDGLRSTR